MNNSREQFNILIQVTHRWLLFDACGNQSSSIRKCMRHSKMRRDRFFSLLLSLPIRRRSTKAILFPTFVGTYLQIEATLKLYSISPFFLVISITWAWWPTITTVMHWLDFDPSFSFSSGAWDNVTGINAPLYGRNDSDDDSYWKNVVGFGASMVDEDSKLSSLESFHSLLARQRLSIK